MDINGEGNYLNKWPILPMYQASGRLYRNRQPLRNDPSLCKPSQTSIPAAFTAAGRLAQRHRYDIAPDLALDRAWRNHWVGIYIHPTHHRPLRIKRSGRVITLFQNSPWFGQHFQRDIVDHGFVPGSQEFDQAMLIARWLADPVDPQTFARYLLKENFNTGEAMPDRKVIIQMATLDTIIPNDNTLAISERGDIPRYLLPSKPRLHCYSSRARLFTRALGCGKRSHQGVLP